MSWLSNRKVLTKLLLATGITLTMVLLTGGLAYSTMQGMAAAARSMYAERTVPMATLGEVTSRAYRIRTNVLKATIVPSVQEVQPLIAAVNEDEGAIQQLLAQYGSARLVEAELTALAAFKASWAEYVQGREKTLAAAAGGDFAAAQQSAYAGAGGQTFAQAAASLAELVKINTEVAQGLNDTIQQSNQRSLWTMALLFLLTLLISLAVNLALGLAISRPLGTVAATAVRLAGGDFTVEELKVRSRDEVGEMARAFNQMVQNLRHLIQGVTASTQSVLAAAEELSAGSEQSAQSARGATLAVGQVASGTTEQARAADEMRRVMEQLQQTIQQIATGSQQTANDVHAASHQLTEMVNALAEVAANAQNVAASTGQAAATARGGARVIEQTVTGMGRIREAVGESAARIRELEKLSTQVGEITETISGIAEQASLLALNAAIEAARAGEHGRGFAVVADEVRKLAERSAASTREIADLVGNIQARTAEAVQAMEVGNSEVEGGSKLAAEAGQALAEILAMVGQAAQDVERIAEAAQHLRGGADQVVQAFSGVAAVTEQNSAATEEMAAGAVQVMSSVERVAAVSQENATAAEEVTSSVEELNAMAEEVATSAQGLAKIAQELQQQVARFKV